VSQQRVQFAIGRLGTNLISQLSISQCQNQLGRVTFADELPIFEQNDDSYELRCSTYVSPKYEPKRRTPVPVGFECRVGWGKWEIDGEEIRATYERYTRTADAQGRLLPLKHEVQVVRLVPRDGKLQVLSGTLPDFGF
jgi:hypothetical protein